MTAADEDFRKFDEIVRTADPGRGDDLSFLGKFPAVEGLISQGLRTSLAVSDWYLFQTYLFLAGRRPTTQYVPIFAEALDSRNGDFNLGDILAYLRDIKDPSSVPAIERALHWRPDWDEFHDLGFKALDALLAIDDDHAWRVIESVRDDDRERVREIARRVLAERNK
ncbi:HEAT repeat domain-containing protein [Amycolatopsis sp. WGS_07]|uniref:HEAT repeat domain-containing protein n=1 Tax=Amycolatopsis sp. WGS_07 TaxID=3076764 RepID=UPI0038734692